VWRIEFIGLMLLESHPENLLNPEILSFDEKPALV
jgi:hypothetical protein